MGSSLSEIIKDESNEINWFLLSGNDFYLRITSDVFDSKDSSEICQSIIKNNSKSYLIQKVMQKIIDSWSSTLLSVNLMFMLKHFFAFVYSEAIPYQFLYQQKEDASLDSHESSFHRLVPCHFNFKEEGKTIYISVPQSSEYDKKIEQIHLIETIKTNFPNLNDQVMRNNEKIHLVDEEKGIVDIDTIFQHYTQTASEDVYLIDYNPFSKKSKVHSIFKATIQTSECDMQSPISLFLKEVVENIANSDVEKDIQQMHAGISLVITMLSSQLFYIEKPISKINYDSFKPSPVVDILMNQPLEVSQIFI